MSAQNEIVLECGICYEHLETSKNNCITSCGHQFCMVCFIKMTQNNNCCPLCRSELYEEKEESEDDEDTISEYTEDNTDEDSVNYLDEIDENGVYLEEIVSRLEKKGISYKDLLLALIPSFRSTDASLTLSKRKEICKSIDVTIDEANDEDEEIRDMAAEDRNTIERPAVERPVNILHPTPKCKC